MFNLRLIFLPFFSRDCIYPSDVKKFIQNKNKADEVINSYYDAINDIFKKIAKKKAKVKALDKVILKYNYVLEEAKNKKAKQIKLFKERARLRRELENTSQQIQSSKRFKV